MTTAAPTTPAPFTTTHVAVGCVYEQADGTVVTVTRVYNYRGMLLVDADYSDPRIGSMNKGWKATLVEINAYNARRYGW